MGRFEISIGAQFGGCPIKLAVTVLSFKAPISLGVTNSFHDRVAPEDHSFAGGGNRGRSQPRMAVGGSFHSF